MPTQIPSKQIIEAAHIRIAPYIHRTAVLQSKQINEILNCSIFFKCENFQKVGAFKSRGAVNAVFSLKEEELIKGVCTHSSGNHAQALARAAALAKVQAHIVMPNNAPKVKIAAVENYGGKIYFCKPTQADREKTLEKVILETDATFIHPYNNLEVIAGQSTAAKELISEIPNLDIIIAPVGGGGLLSGTALSSFYFGNNIKVIGAEPKNADDAYLSFHSGEIHPSNDPQTMADGLLTSLGDITFPIIQKHVEQILVCQEETIINAMKLIYERLKIVIEPSSAVALAVVMENPDMFKNKKLGIILSGGNVDLSGFFESLLDA